jgi:hypothetical protein
MRHLSTVALVILTLTFAHPLSADEPDTASPKSPQAASAIKRHDDAAAKAKSIYDRAMTDLDRKLLTDLDAALDSAMKSKNLDEAKRIDAAKHQAQAALERRTNGAAEPPAPTATKGILIRADRDWQPAFRARRGDRLHIVARGRWCGDVGRRPESVCGPGGLVVDGDVRYCLIGQFEDGKGFAVGTECDVIAPRDGVLSLGMRGQHNVAQGAVEVLITVVPSGKQ